MQPDIGAHQLDAVKRLGNGKILCGGVGTGKSRTSLKYYVDNESPRDIYVFTTAKKRDAFDWLDEAAKFGIGTERDATFHGTITVDSWHNIHKYVQVKDAFLIMDEQKLVGNGTWVKSFYKLAKANRWIMLSGTPGDRWEDYCPVFIANGFYRNRTEFLSDHVVYNHYSKFPKVDRYISVNRLVKNRNALLVDMPYERHTTRHVIDITVDFAKDKMDRAEKDRWHLYENRPLRDVGELYSVRRKIANTDASRLEEVRKLVLKRKKLIVFYNFDYELAMLRSLEPILQEDLCQMSLKDDTSMPSIEKVETRADGVTPMSSSTTMDWPGFEKNVARVLGTHQTTLSGPINVPLLLEDHSSELYQTASTTVQVAEWNGHKHQAIPTTDHWLYLVQYQAGAEGWNCVDTDSICFFSLNYSYRIFEQCQGRIDRLNTPFVDLNYYVLKSEAGIDKEIWKAVSTKKKFQEPKMDFAVRPNQGPKVGVLG